METILRAVSMSSYQSDETAYSNDETRSYQLREFLNDRRSDPERQHFVSMWEQLLAPEERIIRAEEEAKRGAGSFFSGEKF